LLRYLAFPGNTINNLTPMVEKILAHRPNPNKPGEMEYYVKWKDKSHLHLAWAGPEEFQRERYSKTKLQRYHAKNEVLYDENEELFNPLFIEVNPKIDLFIILFFHFILFS
jgi:hypothetical protein